jgi:hypothetical protein
MNKQIYNRKSEASRFEDIRIVDNVRYAKMSCLRNSTSLPPIFSFCHKHLGTPMGHLQGGGGGSALACIEEATEASDWQMSGR